MDLELADLLELAMLKRIFNSCDTKVQLAFKNDTHQKNINPSDEANIFIELAMLNRLFKTCDPHVKLLFKEDTDKFLYNIYRNQNKEIVQMKDRLKCLGPENESDLVNEIIKKLEKEDSNASCDEQLAS